MTAYKCNFYLINLSEPESAVQAPTLKPKPTLASVFKVLDDPDFDKPVIHFFINIYIFQIKKKNFA